ncbi:uncharacterized protein LOC119280184 [Triticum dicoccoides]|uniref:uncharacterized protein LOC119280184 n=1 Tax=Triticum dicoccoides TaxID=85692 RepID=UPI000E7CDB4E|nr:uncharacterized protein LOC119280184 [Triticum dicoccoides]
MTAPPSPPSSRHRPLLLPHASLPCHPAASSLGRFLLPSRRSPPLTLETDDFGKEGAHKGEVLERKVEEFFRALKKGPEEGKANDASTTAKKKAVLGGAPRQVKRDAEREEEDWPRPHLASTRMELPPRWDGPTGTVVLIDKPKGWTSFTVCGKLRRLVKVQKVGHAGTLDPMATRLLIVCVGKATKVVDRYQGMVKGYSGVFRLGEATSTWDADSPECSSLDAVTESLLNVRRSSAA